MNSNTNIEILLMNKIKDLSELLLSICDSETKKQDIKDALIDLPFYKILLFISFLDNNKIDNQIYDFIKLFSLQDTQDNRNKIKEYLNYFIEINKILNEK